MQILYAIAIAAVIGVIVRFSLPHRGSYGISLLPAVSGAVAAVAWALLTWIGWDWSVVGIWLISLGAALVAALLIALGLPPLRRRTDAAFFEHARRVGV